MNGNMVDYLLPVADAGDKSFTNGAQDVIPTALQERKANELVKQIAMQKQLELERGNVDHIMQVLQKDTPDAAIYRALLLQQLESKKKEEEEKKKPGAVKRFAINTAKFLGALALRYLVWQTISHAGDLYRYGPKMTWQKFLAENGVAKTPELAEMSGDAMAAFGDTIMRRNVNFKDLTDNQKQAVLQYAKNNGFDEALNTQKATLGLKSVFRKDDKFYDALPKDAKEGDFTKMWATVVNTGDKEGSIIPLSREELGSNVYDSIFKMGNTKTVITPEDNWFTGNPAIRAIDNSFSHIADITGSNELKRKAVFDKPEYNGMPPLKKKVTGESVPVEITNVPQVSLNDLSKKEVDDAVKIVKANVGNFLANVRSGAFIAKTKYNIQPGDVEDIVQKFLENPRDFASTDKVMEALNPNTSHGISGDKLVEFVTKCVIQKMTVMNKSDRERFYKNLINEMSVTSLPAPFATPHITSDYDPNVESGTDAQKMVRTGIGATGLGLGALASVGMGISWANAPFFGTWLVGTGVGGAVAGSTLLTLYMLHKIF